MDYPLLPKQMPERIQHVWRRTILFISSIFLTLALIGTIVLFLLDWWHVYWGIALGIFLVATSLLTIFGLLLIPYRYTFHRYEITEEDLAFQKGYFFRSTMIVPINRIQHVETEQGPFLRKENLMEVIIHTAATAHRIAGLDMVEAQELREKIVALVKVAKEDV